MCSPTVDTSRQDATAEKIAGLSEDQFNWVKSKYDEEAPTRKAASDTANAVSKEQIQAMQFATGLAKQGAADYHSIYRPQEIAAANEAAAYNTDAKREELAGKARADVEQSYDTARGTMERDMQRAGVNPSDPGYGAAQAGLTRDHSLALTFGANKARTDAETLGRALRSDVIATGRGVVGSQGTQTGLALTAGSNAVANGTAPVTIGQSGVNMVQQGAGQAATGLGSAANIYANSSNAQAGAAQAGAAGAGSLAGAAMTGAAIIF